MQTALRIQTKVLPGNRIEVVAPELKEGESVQVIVFSEQTAEEQAPRRFASVLAFLESLPKAPQPRAFPSWEEYDQHLQAERGSWER